MKKAMWFSLFFGLIAGLTYAQDTQVTSKNAVGYVKVEFVPGYNFIGVNFNAMTDEGVVNIQDLFDTTTLFGGTDRTTSDNVLFWDSISQGYAKAWLFNSGTGHEWDGKWIEWDAPTLASNELVVGQGFWYRSRQTNTWDWVQARPFNWP